MTCKNPVSEDGRKFLLFAPRMGDEILTWNVGNSQFQIGVLEKEVDKIQVYEVFRFTPLDLGLYF